jgi:predicted RNase H-like HicB family nuclease
MKNKKDLNYYLNLAWTYTVEKEVHKGKSYYIIRVNELPGICTHNEDLNAGMLDIKELIACAVEIYQEKNELVPEPVNRTQYKGRILYRSGSERHYLLAKAAKLQHKSISGLLDNIVDDSLRQLNI